METIGKSRKEDSLSEEENQYIQSLSEKEYQAYLIARDHLGILLTVHKTNGFLAWKQSQ